MPPKLPKSLQLLLAKLKHAITDIFDRFEEGELSAVKWRDSMKSILTRFITASFMSGQESPLIGVTEQGYIYEYIKAQLGFIDNFYLSIVSSDEFKTGWRQRAESYANSIVAPFWKGETKMVALPAMPGDMTTPCGQLCACLWDVQAIDEEKGDYDAYWRLNASREIETEHCQICEQRSKEWNPLKIRDNMLVIPPGEAGKEFIEHIKEYLEETSKGGPGSGHFGHAGRPGEVGGSASTDIITGLDRDKNFKHWFGNSKVVDENGNPQVVYHGTAAEILEFDAEKSRDIGFHFGDKDAVNYVVERERNLGKSGENVLPVYLAIENPLQINDTNFGRFEFARALADQVDLGLVRGLNARELRNLADSFDDLRGKPNAALKAAQKTIEYLKSKGFDGLVYQNRKEGRGISWVAFYPNQIKSAIGNIGTFDPNNNSILKGK